LKANETSLKEKMAEDALTRQAVAAAELVKAKALQKKQEAEAEAKKKQEEAEAKKKQEKKKAEKKRQEEKKLEENNQQEKKLEKKVDCPTHAQLESLPPLFSTGRKGNLLRTPDFYYFEEV